MDDNDRSYTQGGSDSTQRNTSPYRRGGSYGSRRTPYVRQPRPRGTAEAIDNLDEDDTFSTRYAHDSNVSVGGSTPFSGRVYSRSRSDIGRLQRNSRYGRYLETPKGRREIFTSRNRSRQIRSRLWLVTIVVLLVIILVLALSMVM